MTEYFLRSPLSNLSFDFTKNPLLGRADEVIE
jgi:hypothetical protein